MRALTRSLKFRHFFLRVLRHQQLPPDVQAIAQAKLRLSLDELTELADCIIEVFWLQSSPTNQAVTVQLKSLDRNSSSSRQPTEDDRCYYHQQFITEPDNVDHPAPPTKNANVNWWRSPQVVNYLLDQFKAASDDDTPQYLIHVIDVPEYLDNVVTTEQWEAMVLRHSDQAYRMDDQLALEPLVARLTVFLLTELGSVDLMRLISWSVLRQLAPYADGEANGGTLNEIRDVCYDDVAEVLEPALTSKYIYKRLTPDVLREATYMGYRVRHSIMKTVGESSWLPPDARNAARRKAEAMRLIIAFPFNLTRLSALERLYADLPDVPLTNTSTGQMGGRGTGRSYVLSWLNASRFQRRIAIRYPTEIFFWLGAVNAQHTYSTNTVNLAGALLEPVIYYPGAPVAYNYGGLGQLMGHEMMHGFDVTGRLYDEHGAKSNWWPKEATKVYTEQTSCLRSIHRLALKKRSLALNPMDSEDLADDMGVRVAFNALRNITGASDRGGTRKVAGFSELQLFFLGHCAKMCDPRVPPRERDSSKPYAPNWARCVVPLMNMPEFADAFQCASGTLMNPERKCQFW
ncbi:hypothetical protein HPB51_005172 [Rhipicephalus microplus]|uniref:Peptidase M13 C-terminal domain-containing protein n=1 Tax=Rhipicephalus microplus TaxID=6941 RepID=A0A9J6DL56_RHIMP|nr:hypothetical protein HPB51_005172 [Rhipicephalus microplus]